MSPERLRKVEEIYHAALELPPEERNTFLQASCAGDDALLREIDSLLAYEDSFDSLIDEPPNQYKILSLLGEGGMGAVYLAQDTTLERKVALKLLPGEFSEDKIRLNRFFQDAKSASALNHPNILTVHEIGKFDRLHFIVTEYINGRTLKKYLT